MSKQPSNQRYRQILAWQWTFTPKLILKMTATVANLKQPFCNGLNITN